MNTAVRTASEICPGTKRVSARRIAVDGTFLRAGDDRLFIKGVRLCVADADNE